MRFFLENKKLETGYRIYLLFVVSWFLHLGSRLPILGSIRFDMLLVLTLLIFLCSDTHEQPEKKKKEQVARGGTRKIIYGLIIYVLLTLPLVEWPGSVLNHGLTNFIKAIIFYFFTIKFVRTTRQLKIFIIVFVLCQLFRIVEPMYLHLTQGYWGSQAYIGGGQMMNRLGGAPADIINPNGLAFVILTVIPFLYYFLSYSGWTKICVPPLFAVSVYALQLTASRSGMIALLLVLIAFFIKSKRKVLLLFISFLSATILFSALDANQRDRYLSIVDSHSKNAATAQGRITGIQSNFTVAMRKPLFGHGLGTSKEANANFANHNQRAHNLYAEVAQELGFVGLGIFLFYIWRVIKQVGPQMKVLSTQFGPDHFFSRLNNSLKVWFVMNLFFSLASYGLSSYEWYLFPGICESLAYVAGQSKLIKES